MTSLSNLKPLVLHAHSSGPNPYKVAIVLEALGVPYQVKVWQFGDGPNGVKGPRYLQINENGRVPAVEDPNTGVVSWESLAVINYLLRVYDGENRLGPKGSSEQARVDYDKWTSLLLSTLGPMQGQVNWFRHYNATKNEDALERYSKQAYQYYGVLEGQLKRTGGASILPGGFSAVDAHYYPWAASAPYGGLDLARFPHLKKWLDGMADMKEVKDGYKKVQEGEQVKA